LRLRVAQRLDLARFQKAPFARVQIELQCAVADALDLLDVMTNLLEHAADLPVASFGQRHLVPGIVLVPHQIDSGGQRVRGLGASRHAGTGASHGSCSRSFWRQVDAAAQLVDLVLGGRAADFYLIGLGDVRGGLGELLHECAVVGQQQQPFAQVVEPSDGEHPCFNALEQVENDWPALRVRNGGDVSLRLVEHDINVAFGSAQQLPVQSNFIAARVGLRSKCADLFSVNADPPGRNQLFSLAPRGHAGRRQNLLQSLLCHKLQSYSVRLLERARAPQASASDSTISGGIEHVVSCF
jgi:hypothetical protein